MTLTIAIVAHVPSRFNADSGIICAGPGEFTDD
jgi:hypothetical protein